MNSSLQRPSSTPAIANSLEPGADSTVPDAVASAPDILKRIVGTKKQELVQSLKRCSREEMAERARVAPAPRPFRAALLRPDIAVIAEIKKASPAAGLIRPDFDAGTIARQFEAGGAAALSVLTDATYFQGSMEALQAARAAVNLPVLRKDFVIDPYQVYEARAGGADAVLLIVSILDEMQLCGLYNLAHQLGMDALVEVHTAEEMELAVRIEADLVGINNRNLKRFVTSLDTTVTLAPRAPRGAVLASLSGIHGVEDVEKMAAAGVDAVLVGESLMRQENVEHAVRRLTGISRHSHSGASG